MSLLKQTIRLSDVAAGCFLGCNCIGNAHQCSILGRWYGPVISHQFSLINSCTLLLVQSEFTKKDNWFSNTSTWPVNDFCFLWWEHVPCRRLFHNVDTVLLFVRSEHRKLADFVLFFLANWFFLNNKRIVFFFTCWLVYCGFFLLVFG